MGYEWETVFQHIGGAVAVVTGRSEDLNRWEFEIWIRGPRRLSSAFSERELAAWQSAIASFPEQGPVMPRGWQYVKGRIWGRGASTMDQGSVTLQ